MFERSSLFSSHLPTETDMFLSKCVLRGWHSLLRSSTLKLSDRILLLRTLLGSDDSVSNDIFTYNHPLGTTFWLLRLFDSLPTLTQGLPDAVLWICRALNKLMCLLPHCHSIAWCTPNSLNHPSSSSSTGEMTLSAENSSSPLTPTSDPQQTSSFFYTYLYQQCASLLIHALSTGSGVGTSQNHSVWVKIEALLWPHLLGCGQHFTHGDVAFRTHPLVASLSVDLWCTLISLSDDVIHQRSCFVLAKLVLRHFSSLCVLFLSFFLSIHPCG